MATLTANAGSLRADAAALLTEAPVAILTPTGAIHALVDITLDGYFTHWPWLTTWEEENLIIFWQPLLPVLFSL